MGVFMPRYTKRIGSDRAFLTVAELVAAGYGSRVTIWRHIKAGKIPAIKVNGSVLIPRDEFEHVLNVSRVDKAVARWV